MNDIVAQVRQFLTENADDKLRESGQRFFKEPIKCYGLKTTAVSGISKKMFSVIKKRPKAEIFSYCEALWQSGYMEESFIACSWAEALHKAYEPADFAVFEKWVNSYVSNWASCDTLCNHSVGNFLMMYPEYVEQLKTWAVSSNRWSKRAAAVSLIIPARKGMFLQDVFSIADLMLHDPDDLVQKGYGWMLKSASQAHQQEVFDFLMQRKTSMPRTAFRYALEKMPKELRAQAMSKA